MGTHRLWSAKESEYLRKHYISARSVKAIAARLGFCQAQVYLKARYMNLGKRLRVGANKIQFTRREIKFIKDNFHTHTNPQLARKLGKTLTVVRNKCRELGLLHMQLQYWTPEQVEFITANYKHMGDTQLAIEMQKRWPRKNRWTNKHIDKKRGYLGLKRTIEEQFRIRTGRFNKKDYANFDGKQFPQGKKRLWFQNGRYVWMIKSGKYFVPLHRYKWEKLRGKIPPGKKLHFIDGDRTNCRISNLVLLTKSELARRVSIKNHQQLSDSYIAGLLAWRNPEMKRHLLQHPGIIKAKRDLIISMRMAGQSKCKVINHSTK